MSSQWPFKATLASPGRPWSSSLICVLPITSECRDTPLFRISVQAQASNGLIKASQIMVDKAQTLSSHRLGAPIGRLKREEMQAVDRALAVFLGVI